MTNVLFLREEINNQIVIMILREGGERERMYAWVPAHSPHPLAGLAKTQNIMLTHFSHQDTTSPPRGNTAVKLDSHS